MKDRIIQLLDAEHLSSAKFADIIGVQRSSISHIISGRNKPSFDFLQKTLKEFPMISAEWLLLGRGSMYSRQGGASTTLFGDQQDNEINKGIDKTEGGDQVIFDPNELKDGDNESNDAIESQEFLKRSGGSLAGMNDNSLRGKEIARIILLYTDNSFDTYKPAK
ncbi:MAG: helix-turn-helix domain-containing protein [Bacteroidales bacterium]|nr:helix-turn-helix domain-containing protein [Bacteroidales bacterium]